MEYRLAPEVKTIADRLIFDEKNAMRHLAKCTMLYVYFTGAKGRKAFYWGKATKIGNLPALMARGKLDDEFRNPQEYEGFQIEINADLWFATQDETERESVVFHYLCRCVEDDGILRTAEPSFAFFTAEIEKYGGKLPRVDALVAILEQRKQKEQLELPVEDGHQDGEEAHVAPQEGDALQRFLAGVEEAGVNRVSREGNTITIHPRGTRRTSGRILPKQEGAPA